MRARGHVVANFLNRRRGVGVLKRAKPVILRLCRQLSNGSDFEASSLLKTKSCHRDTETQGQPKQRGQEFVGIYLF